MSEQKGPVMTDREVASLIEGRPFGNAANNLAAHGCDQRIVDYLHAANASQNRASFDRDQILNALKNVAPDVYELVLTESFIRLNKGKQRNPQ